MMSREVRSSIGVVTIQMIPKPTVFSSSTTPNRATGEAGSPSRTGWIAKESLETLRPQRMPAAGSSPLTVRSSNSSASDRWSITCLTAASDEGSILIIILGPV